MSYSLNITDVAENSKIVNIVRFLYRRRDWKNILEKTEIEY
jgi:hypothetical protein